MEENPYQAPKDLKSRGPRTSSTGGHTVNEEKVFGVIVRSLGLLAAAHGLITIVGGIAPLPTYRPVDYLIGGIPYSVVGLALLLRADWFVSIAYGSRHAAEENQDNSEKSTE